MPQAIGAAAAAVFAAVGVTLTAAATAAIGSAVFNLALGVGFSLLTNSLRQQPAGVKPTDGQTSVTQPVAARRRYFGRIGSAEFYP